jgi:DNA-binding MarR family transcriptional regulator
MPDPVDHAESEEIIGRLMELSSRMHDHFETISAGLGLTRAEGQMLHRLASPRPMRSMADSLNCDASYITALADGLESLGLVTREPDPTDRRVRQLVLTERGREMRTEMIRQVHATTPALVGLDTAQRATLVELLRVLAAAPVVVRSPHLR